MKQLALAGVAMAALTIPPPRGLIGIPRADASDPKAMIAQLQNAFEEFKTTHEQKLNAKIDDTLLDQKLEAINASMSSIEAALSEKIAAASLGGAGIGDMPASDPEYVKGFKAFMRKGENDSKVMAAIDIGTAADGGYMAPVEWDRSVTDKLKLLSPIREDAQVIQISGNGFSRIYNDGVIGSGWVGETAARPTTTTPGFTTLAFNTGEIYANPQITQQALDDIALDLEKWIVDEVEGEFAIQEGIAFLSGNGTNKPTGVLNYVTGGANAATHPFGAITAITAAGTTAVTADELLSLVASLPSERETARSKFYANRASIFNIRKLKDTTNNYLWQPTITADQPSTLLGKPVKEVSGMPAMTTGNISFLYGDMFKTYLVIDRIGLRMLRDPYTNKPFVGFYTTKRVGGGVQNPEFMKALKQA